MGSYDEVKGVLEPYDAQVKVWDDELRVYEQGDTVRAVGMAETYAVRLNGPPEEPFRYLWVQDLRITATMAHQPLLKASVFDKWGKYLGRGGEELEDRSRNPIEEVLEALTDKKPASGRGSVRHHEAEVEEDELVVTHRFHLRPDFTVEVELPEDLSRREADRLALFFCAIPLEGPLEES